MSNHSEKISSETALDQQPPEGKKPMTLITTIPDKSIVTSHDSILSQTIAVNFDEYEVNGILEWIDTIPDEELIRKAMLTTINNLSAINADQWDTASHEDKIHTLGECIREKMCTCFHRAIMFNVLMNRRDINCLTVCGRVIETIKESLQKDPKSAPLFSVEALLPESELENIFHDFHMWNIIQRNGGRYYLIDTAYLINGKPVVQEIVFDNTNINSFIVQTSDGRYRHYLSSGTLSVQSIGSQRKNDDSKRE